ncbi:MAG: TRAP transporter substrate-binding protein DctP [Xanthobacteraceae bacterium]
MTGLPQRGRSRLLAAGLLAAAMASGARAEDAALTLRLADSLPAGHIIHEAVTKPFIAAVEARTGGSVTITHYPAEQLGKAKDMLRLTQSGVVDIGYIVPSYASDKMPLTAVAELPGGFRDACQATAAYWALSRDGRFFAEKEFAPNGVRPLITFALPTYQILLSTRKAVNGLADLEGLKIRTAGGALDLMMRSIKAVPIRMSPPEIYESMSRGTLDGAMIGYQSAASYDLLGLVKTGTLNEPLSSVVITYSINAAKWRALPEKLRDVLAQEGERITRESCAKFAAAEARAVASARAKGVRLIEFSADDARTMAAVFETVGQDWAAGLDGRGKPGTEALKVWRDALRAAAGQ